MDYIAIANPKDVFCLATCSYKQLPSRIPDTFGNKFYQASAVTRSQRGIKIKPPTRLDPSKTQVNEEPIEVKDPTETTMPENNSLNDQTSNPKPHKNFIPDNASILKAHNHSPATSHKPPGWSNSVINHNDIIYLHLLFACRNQKSLKLLSKKNNIIGFP